VLFGTRGSPDARILSVSVDLEAATPGGRLVESLRPVVEVIRARFADRLRVEELATVAGLTPAQLERRMRRVFGVSVKQYQLRTRLEEAIALLLGTDRPIGEIASRCGYYDQSSLTRHLKRVMGATPGQLRRDGA
jgi:AraC-like DNA-binding protein